MPTAGAKPVEERLAKLEQQWLEAAEEPGLRLLRWFADDEECRLIEGFCEFARTEASAVPDFLWPVRLPAGDELEASLDEVLRAQLELEGVPVGAPGLAAALSDLVEHCCEPFTRFGLVLRLDGADPSAVEALVDSVLDTAPDALCVVLLDDPASTSGDALATRLAAAEPAAVAVRSADLELTSLPEEIVAELPGEGPGHDYRAAFVELGGALGRDDPDGARAAGSRAIDVAERAGWPHLEATAHLALGAGMLGTGDLARARIEYDAAEEAARRALDADEPGADALAAQAANGRAVVEVSADRHADAAEHFGRAADLAREAGDSLQVFEALRMRAWCLAQAKRRKEAYDVGLQALTAIAEIEPDRRANTTLPYLARLLVDCAPRAERASGGPLDVRLAELLGPDWRQALP